MCLPEANPDNTLETTTPSPELFAGSNPLGYSMDMAGYSHKRPFRYFVKRILWASIQLPFLRGAPKRLSPLRIALLRLFGAIVKGPCLVCGGVKIWEPWNLELGAYSTIGTNAEIYNLSMIKIGAHSVISQEVHLCSASHDYLDTAFSLFSQPISIGSSVWIAARAFVAPGVSIGDGAVVGACSVVTSDLPPWTVCVGSPCRPVKPRTMRQGKPTGSREAPG
jgi:putative colanic acid biosynthesis acetyltransferase WcaF